MRIAKVVQESTRLEQGVFEDLYDLGQLSSSRHHKFPVLLYRGQRHGGIYLLLLVDLLQVITNLNLPSVPWHYIGRRFQLNTTIS